MKNKLPLLFIFIILINYGCKDETAKPNKEDETQKIIEEEQIDNTANVLTDNNLLKVDEILKIEVNNDQIIINNIQLGMSFEEVITILGTPDSVNDFNGYVEKAEWYENLQGIESYTLFFDGNNSLYNMDIIDLENTIEGALQKISFDISKGEITTNNQQQKLSFSKDLPYKRLNLQHSLDSNTSSNLNSLISNKENVPNLDIKLSDFTVKYNSFVETEYQRLIEEGMSPYVNKPMSDKLSINENVFYEEILERTTIFGEFNSSQEIEWIGATYYSKADKDFSELKTEYEANQWMEEATHRTIEPLIVFQSLLSLYDSIENPFELLTEIGGSRYEEENYDNEVIEYILEDYKILYTINQNYKALAIVPIEFNLDLTQFIE